MPPPSTLPALDALPAELTALLSTQPGFSALVQRRLRDTLPQTYASTPLEAFSLNGEPLPLWLARSVSGTSLPEGARGEVTTAASLSALTTTANAALQRFVRQFYNEAQAIWRDGIIAFWTLRPAHGHTTPAQRLSAWLQARWQAELAMRSADNTLPAAQRMIAQAALNASPGWRAALVLRAGSTRWVLPGASVLAARDALNDPTQPVLLTTCAWGMEAFDTWAALHQALAERLEDDVQGRLLRQAFAPDDLHRVLRSETLQAEPYSGSLFDQLSSSLIQRQKAAAVHAWDAALARFRAGEFSAACQHLDASLALAPLLSNTALLQTHYVLLLGQRMPAWLKALAPAEMLTLNLAKTDLWAATLATQAKGLASLEQFNNADHLLQFAREALLQRLRTLGVSLAPEAIFITTVAAVPQGPLVPPFNPAETGYAAGNSLDRTGDTIGLVPRTVSLLTLALENISPLDKDYLLTAIVRDGQGKPIPGLSAAAVRKMVRFANVGGSYQAYLQQHLRSGPQASWRRQTYRELLRTKMRYEGFKAAYRHHMDRTRTLHPWIEALTGAGDTAAASSSHGPVAAWQLLLRETPVHGVYLLGPEPGNRQVPLLLYAPGNPNGQHWSYFASRQALTRDWLGMAGVAEYLIHRTALAEQAPLRKLFKSQAINNLIRAQAIRGDFFAAAYRSETRLVMANADALTRSNQEVNREAAADLVLTLIELVSIALPAKATATLSLSRAIWAAVQFFQEVDNEDGDLPLHHVAEFNTHLLEAVAALSTSPVMSKVIRRLSYRSGIPLPTGFAAANQGRYLRYKLDSHGKGQVYEAQPILGGHSEYYIEDASGRRYEVLYDGEHWRVVDARKPDTLYKPVIRPNADGHWEMVDIALWRGALPDVPAMLRKAGTAADPGLAEGVVTPRNGVLLLRLGTLQYTLRPSVLAGRYTVVMPPALHKDTAPTVKLRKEATGWEAKARVSTFSSPWVSVSMT